MKVLQSSSVVAIRLGSSKSTSQGTLLDYCVPHPYVETSILILARFRFMRYVKSSKLPNELSMTFTGIDSNFSMNPAFNEVVFFLKVKMFVIMGGTLPWRPLSISPPYRDYTEESNLQRALYCRTDRVSFWWPPPGIEPGISSW